MKRAHRLLAVVALLVGMFSAPYGNASAAGGAEGAGRMVQYVVLESGLGVRWEPSESILQRLRTALPRPWEELKPLSAPFARSDKPIVTAEALAWTVLAELAYARRLEAQGSPEALVYLYLASRQVGFAQSGLLDRSTDLYRPEWTAGSPAGDPKLEDQLWMLWALSAYSAAGGLLPSDVPESERLFRRQTAPLADRLFQAAKQLLRESLTGAAGPALPLRKRILWAAALRAYERAGLAYAQEASRLRTALLPTSEELTEAVAWAESPFGAKMTLRELADRVLLLRAVADLTSEPSLRGRHGEAWGELLSRPAVRRLLASVPWPAEVVYDPAAEGWTPRSSALDVGAAMALAYGILSQMPQGSPGTASSGESKAGGALERLAQILDEVVQQLESLEGKAEEAQAQVGTPPGPSLPRKEPMVRESALPRGGTGRPGEGAWSSGDVLLVGGALVLGLSTVLLAWWGRQRI